MNKKKNSFNSKKGKNGSIPLLTHRTKRWIKATALFLLAIIISLSFWESSGRAGQVFLTISIFLVGKAVYIIPFLFILGGLFFLKPQQKGKIISTFLGIFIVLFGVAGLLGMQNLSQKQGGWLGYLLSKALISIFGFLVSNIIFVTAIILGFIIFSQFVWRSRPKEQKEKQSLLIRILKRPITPSIRIKEGGEKTEGGQEIQPKISLFKEEPKLKDKKLQKTKEKYLLPSIDLLSKNEGSPFSGNIKQNSTIIKKTLENFGIPVEMAEVNVGPTVTQYAFKPAEGVKLSKITTLSNNLALALASHPIRIEAPIPGKSLVGIEVPNKRRSIVALRNLIANNLFQNSQESLLFCLGRNVSGAPMYAELGEMPHLLVAGATGTGKTTAADTLIFTEKGMLTFEELCPLPLNSEVDFKIKLVTRDGIETTSKNYNNGICQFYKLITGRGYQVEATTEHPLWVMNEDGSQSWKAASFIKKGDFVAISRGPVLFGNKINISDFKPSRIWGNTKQISFPSKMTPQLAQFLGFLTADGGLSIEGKGLHRTVYTQANSYLIRLYKKSLKELFGITQFIEIRSGSNPKNKAKDIVVNSKHLKEFLAYLGMDSSKSPQKEIPRAIREAPKEIVTAYLRAIFDNDGYVGEKSIEFCISSKKLARQVHLMLLNFGIVSSLAIKKVKNYADNEYYRLSIFGQEARTFIQEIGFIRKEKYKKAKHFLKLSSNPNVDLIPHISHLLKTLRKKYLNSFARLTNRGWIYQSGILVPKYAFNSLRSYNSGFRAPGYQAIERILDFYQPIYQEPEYQELEKIAKRNFYWDKVEKIERTSGVGYDFYVPGSDSFVGNGFVNHNTIFLNSLILSLLYKNNPDNLRLILIDPKRVEFQNYNELPHLLCPVIYDASKTINTLQWLTKEMERRFEIFSTVPTRNIITYNKTRAVIAANNTLPYIILIVDELADLMAARGREMEAGVVRLAQMARATGIHLVLATQRPSVEVITGLIKANITSRITFQVASQVDSRTVLDMAGAEKLLGSGDMLFISAKAARPRRIQAPFVSEKDVEKVTEFIKKQNNIVIEGGAPSPLIDSLKNSLEQTEEKSETFFEGEDPLYEETKKLVLETKKASASFLQRRLRVGYARAARLIDMLEEKKIIGPADGAKPRQVYGEPGSPQRGAGIEEANEETDEDSEWQKV